MQTKVDTKGYIIKGLRRAVRIINSLVDQRELYFIYYDLISNDVTVNYPAGCSATKICIMESGVYKMTQQELANVIVDKIEKVKYNKNG